MDIHVGQKALVLGAAALQVAVSVVAPALRSRMSEATAERPGVEQALSRSEQVRELRVRWDARTRLALEWRLDGALSPPWREVTIVGSGKTVVHLGRNITVRESDAASNAPHVAHGSRSAHWLLRSRSGTRHAVVLVAARDGQVAPLAPPEACWLQPVCRDREVLRASPIDI